MADETANHVTKLTRLAACLTEEFARARAAAPPGLGGGILYSAALTTRMARPCIS